ncbi:MAG: hypothetical protein ACE5K4_08675 [Candidatus Hydrothermarchaeota archaeon]
MKYRKRPMQGSKWKAVVDIVDDFQIQDFPKMSFRVGVLYDEKEEPWIAVGFFHGRTYRYAAMDAETAKKLRGFIKEAIEVAEGEAEVVEEE